MKVPSPFPGEGHKRGKRLANRIPGYNCDKVQTRAMRKLKSWGPRHCLSRPRSFRGGPVVLARAAGWRGVAAAAVICLGTGSGFTGAKADTEVPGRQAYRTDCSIADLNSGARTCTYTFEH